MSKAVEEFAEKRAEARRIETITDNVRSLMETMKWSAEQAMDALRVSADDRKILLKRF